MFFRRVSGIGLLGNHRLAVPGAVLAFGFTVCEFPGVEGKKPEVPGDSVPESQDPPKERYGESYLAMDAQQKKAHPMAPARRSVSKGGNKLLLLFVVVMALLYFQGGRLMAWLERQPTSARILKVIRENLRPADEKAGPPLEPLNTGTGATGGETTFASGQGFGTVSPDDGGQSFRVVVPPNETN